MRICYWSSDVCSSDLVDRASCAPFEPVEREAGDRGRGVIGDEMRRVIHIGELDAIGVPIRIPAGAPPVLLGPGAVAAAEDDEGGHLAGTSGGGGRSVSMGVGIGGDRCRSKKKR